MPTSIPLTQVLGIIAVLAIVFYAYGKVKAAGKKARHFCATFMEAVEQNKNAAESLAKLPQYVDGHQKVAMALTAEVVKFRLAVSQFSTLLMKGEPTQPTLSTYDDNKLGKAWDIDQLVESGAAENREQAEEMIRSMGVE